MDSNIQNEEKMMFKKLIKIYLLDDRKAIVLFNLFKLGWVNTTDKRFKGRSIVVGIWRFELQFNLSYVTSKIYADIIAEA